MPGDSLPAPVDLKQAAEVTEPGLWAAKARGPGEEGPVGWERLHGEEAEPWNLEGDLDREGQQHKESWRRPRAAACRLWKPDTWCSSPVVIFSACLRGLHALLLGKKGV